MPVKTQGEEQRSWVRKLQVIHIQGHLVHQSAEDRCITQKVLEKRKSNVARLEGELGPCAN